jgi:hypothetical protein
MSRSLPFLETHKPSIGPGTYGSSEVRFLTRKAYGETIEVNGHTKRPDVYRHMQTSMQEQVP